MGERARRAALALGLLVAAAPLAAQGPRDLARRLDRRLDQPPFDRQLWGVAVLDDRGMLLYGRNADRLFMPASNTKLVVTAAAAALLPGDFTVQTSVYAAGPVANGAVAGDLVLYGRGDPTFSSRCYAVDTTAAGACQRDAMAPLRALAAQLARRGIRRVEGDLVGDGSYFEPQLVHPSWEAYDLTWWYAAPVSGLGFNDNAIDLAFLPGDSVGAPAKVAFTPDFGDLALENRTVTVPAGSEETIDFFRTPDGTGVYATGTVALGGRPRTEHLALPDPNLFAARAFRAALAEAGIAVLGRTLATTDSTDYALARHAPPLAEVASRPLRDWLFPILSTSQNWFAEMLLKQLGRQFGAAGSWEEGLRVERRFLVDSVGIDSTQFALADGSGLAASNLVSPLAFARLLRYMRAHRSWPAFSAGLPVAAQSGTLRTRFRGTPLEGKVRAKTGSIARTNTLSGYVEAPDGHLLTFSLQANHHALPSRVILPELDSVVVDLVRGRKGH